MVKQAGFHTLNLSFVNSEPSTKKKMRRPQPFADFDSILREAENIGLHVVAYAILGPKRGNLKEGVGLFS